LLAAGRQINDSSKPSSIDFIAKKMIKIDSLITFLIYQIIVSFHNLSPYSL